MRLRLGATALVLGLAGTTAFAVGRSGGNYRITSESTGPTGQRSSGGGAVQMTATAGGVVDSASSSSGAVQTQNGFSGQQVEVVDVQFGASPTTMVEGASLQLAAPAMYDDNSMVDLADQAVWSVLAGPVAGFGASGSALAANVYQDTPSVVSGHYQGFSGDVALLVVNTSDDDYGLYGGDGASDTWQIGIFGESNPQGVGSFDADFDGQNNTLEFAAMTDPTNMASRLELDILRTGASTVEVRVDPSSDARQYLIQYLPDPYSPTWHDLAPAAIVTNGSERSYLDAATTSTMRFYRVRIDYSL